MNIEYKNTQIHYTSKGEGNPLILVHGFLETKEIWAYFAEDLSQKRQVVCIDLPGHGKSGCFAEVHTMAEMAEIVQAVLDELQIEKASLAGHSMGGYVILEFYKKFPTMVTALVLINSTPEADSEERKINRDRAAALVVKNKDAFVSMAISNLLMPENNRKFSDEIQELKEKAYKMSIKGITASIYGMKNRPDNTGIFSGFTGSKYIVAGKKDPVIDYNQIKEVSRRCKSRLKTFSDGHLSFIENKRALLDFMRFID